VAQKLINTTFPSRSLVRIIVPSSSLNSANTAGAAGSGVCSDCSMAVVSPVVSAPFCVPLFVQASTVAVTIAANRYLDLLIIILYVKFFQLLQQGSKILRIFGFESVLFSVNRETDSPRVQGKTPDDRQLLLIFGHCKPTFFDLG